MMTMLFLLCLCVATSMVAEPLNSAPSLPAKQTFALIAGLSDKATLADFRKIMGTPGVDIGGASHGHRFPLDDGSSLIVHVSSSEDSIQSITLQTADGHESDVLPLIKFFSEMGEAREVGQREAARLLGISRSDSVYLIAVDPADKNDLSSGRWQVSVEVTAGFATFEATKDKLGHWTVKQTVNIHPGT